MSFFVDAFQQSFNKYGEELCGDQLRVLHSGDKSWAVLSDGIGSGVQANILASLTADIMIHMLKEAVDLSEVVETLIGSLPVNKEHGLAYATFTVVEIDHASLRFRISNFDNPPTLFFRGGKRLKLAYLTHEMAQHRVKIGEGTLQRGDFIALVSDGVVNAGPGAAYNYDWSEPQISDFIEGQVGQRLYAARPVVQSTMQHTRALCQGMPGDDASMIGLLLRESRRAMVFTGPPLDSAEDDALAQRVLNFDGTRIVCGGTTGEIVAINAGYKIHLDPIRFGEKIPPTGFLPGIDLLTEGIITLSAALELLDESEGDPLRLSSEHNGAVELAHALLEADDILFVVGQKINPAYQNPALPMSISIRKNLVEKLAERLQGFNKRVTIEYH